MKKFGEKLLGILLVFGTSLISYITIYGLYDAYFIHNTWLYRDGILAKVVFAILSIDLIVMTIAGFISCISFFRRRELCRILTKVIIVNVALYILVFICTLIKDLLSYCWQDVIMLIVLSTCVYGLWRLWNIVDSITWKKKVEQINVDGVNDEIDIHSLPEELKQFVQLEDIQFLISKYGPIRRLNDSNYQKYYTSSIVAYVESGYDVLAITRYGDIYLCEDLHINKALKQDLSRRFGFVYAQNIYLMISSNYCRIDSWDIYILGKDMRLFISYEFAVTPPDEFNGSPHIISDKLPSALPNVVSELVKLILIKLKRYEH